MAVLKIEAYNAGFNAAGASPIQPFDSAWATFSSAFGASLPLVLRSEFKRGYSSAISYKMDSQ